MKVKQLSVFLENKPGRLGHPCEVLAAAGINILTLCLADTEKFGLLRLIVDDPEKARKALEKAGCAVNVADVLAIEVADHPGGMEAVLAVLEPAGINVDYMYAFTLKRGRNAIMIVRFSDTDKAMDLLKKNGINVLKSVALYEST